MKGRVLLTLIAIAVVLPLSFFPLDTTQQIAIGTALMLLVGVPILIANEYRMLRRPRPVVRAVHQERLAALETIVPELSRLGFRQLDAFLLATQDEPLHLVFVMGNQPTYALVSDPPENPLPDAARGIRIELRTELDDGSSLTSATKAGRGTPLRREEDYLQIFPGADLGEL